MIFLLLDVEEHRCFVRWENAVSCLLLLLEIFFEVGCASGGNGKVLLIKLRLSQPTPLHGGNDTCFSCVTATGMMVVSALTYNL